jgi:hypothetical protein
MATTQAAGDIERLPEELLAAVISLTSPPDACRAAAVSRTFRAGADSDAVWSHFLPGDLPEFDEGELACTAPSKKALFQCLSHKPALLPCKLLVRTYPKQLYLYNYCFLLLDQNRLIDRSTLFVWCSACS